MELLDYKRVDTLIKATLIHGINRTGGNFWYKVRHSRKERECQGLNQEMWRELLSCDVSQA